MYGLDVAGAILLGGTKYHSISLRLSPRAVTMDMLEECSVSRRLNYHGVL